MHTPVVPHAKGSPQQTGRCGATHEGKRDEREKTRETQRGPSKRHTHQIGLLRVWVLYKKAGCVYGFAVAMPSTRQFTFICATRGI